MPKEASCPTETPQWLAYLQLFRAPNLFTALADVSMGYLFVRQSLQPWATFVCLAGASACLYTAGMVLNDVYDCEVDARQRPQRPIPSGRISRRWACWMGYELLLVGMAFGWLGTLAGWQLSSLAWRSGAIATCLGVCVWLYNAVLKSTWAGPTIMGMCRMLNVLMGMSLATVSPEAHVILSFPPQPWLVAGGIGTYVLGVTLYARREVDPSDRGNLMSGSGFIGLGLLMLAYFPRIPAVGAQYFIEPRTVWPLALLLIAVPIIRRCLSGIAEPTPARVQGTVKLCLISLIVLDASICLLVCPWYWAVAILALLVPAMILGRWIPST